MAEGRALFSRALHRKVLCRVTHIIVTWPLWVGTAEGGCESSFPTRNQEAGWDCSPPRLNRALCGSFCYGVSSGARTR